MPEDSAELEEYSRYHGKMLSLTLRQLEADGILEPRTVYAEVPPRVEYKLSAQGKSLLPLSRKMAAWEEEDKDEGEMVESEPQMKQKNEKLFWCFF